MNPDQQTPTPTNPPLVPESTAPSAQTSDLQRQAAANVVRSQIDSLYDNNGQPVGQQIATQIEDINPYERTHSDNVQPDLEQWKQYHSAWQTYYQKYYEGYYTHHLKSALGSASASSQTGGYFKDQPADASANLPLSQDEALFDLRQKLRQKVVDSASRVRKSRHFVPIISGVLVILIFAFLQYNQLIIGTVMAYVSPGSIDPQNIVVDPKADVNVSPDPRLIIPKINVDVPVLYDIGNDYNSQMAAMQKGVAQFAIPGASSHPGQVGNTVIAGHSSNDLIDQGDYKFIFAQLEKMSVGDTIYANYQSKRYTYTVTNIQIVKPTDVSALVYPTTKPLLTLVTCTPLGTSTNRLLVTAEQVNPDPNASTAAPVSSGSAQTSLPGQSSPTLFERLFGGGN
jgi:sortase A